MIFFHKFLCTRMLVNRGVNVVLLGLGGADAEGIHNHRL